ncbi:F-box domain-containing protein [Mycena indigotica]|uniref:F-box domain-containing protein n=1 Tax=Mycena indigotica TaxID=2126181 RepID=A0A8H6VYR8_9AGAR|nr:F-box domain-containing protein [Mycena indigotica]KAF7293064.1 F-box domain-containing protein [Mycena indigotica]
MAAAVIRFNISALEHKITSLEEQLAATRSELRREKELLSDIVYPINTLPPEILSRILVRAHADFSEYQHFAILDSFSMGRGLSYRLLLASVCKQWRNVVWSTCEMWTRVTVHCGRVKSASEALQTWLPRSGGLPVDFSIILVDETADAVWDVLVKHSAQWRHVDLCTADSVTLSLANAASTLPFFETLWLTGDVAMEDGEHISAPNWHALKINVPFVLYQLALPLAQITSLELNGQSSCGILEMLALMPELTSLVLCVVETEREQEPTVSSCFLSQLKSLHYNTALPVAILAGLHPPLLSHLSFVDLPSFTPIGELIARCGCSIRSLSVQNSSRNPLQAMTWFKGLPTLQTLDFQVDNWRRKDFRTFHEIVTMGWPGSDSEKTKLCDLEAITLRGCPRDLAESWMLTDLVERRWSWVDGMSRVHTLSLCFAQQPRDTMPIVKNDLDKFVDLGLKLELDDGPFARERLGRAPFPQFEENEEEMDVDSDS